LETLLAHRRAIPDIEALIEPIEVECATLPDLVERAGSDRLDLLQMDAEGYDAKLVQSIDFRRFAPAILRYEHKHLTRNAQRECIELLLDHGYQVAVEADDTLAYRDAGEPGGAG
jgi:hypothetical protein